MSASVAKVLVKVENPTINDGQRETFRQIRTDVTFQERSHVWIRA